MWVKRSKILERLNCSQGPAEELSGRCSMDTRRSVTSSASLIPSASYDSAWWTDTCQTPRSGTTCAPLTGRRGEDAWTLFRVDSPARTLASPETVQELREADRASGVTWPASFARWDRDSCSWKTAQRSLLG